MTETNIPQTKSIIRNRLGFAIAGAVLGVIYTAYMFTFGGTYPSDERALALGAVISGFFFGFLLWPKQARSTVKMIFIGMALMVLISWVSNTSIGFFGYEERASRAQSGSANGALSLMGAALVAIFMTLANLLMGLGVFLLPGAIAGWLFRSRKN